MGGVDGHGATSGLKRGLERIGKAFAIVIIGVGHRNFLDAFFHQHLCHDHALACIRGGGPEKQAIVGIVRVAQPRACGRGGDHHNTIGQRHVLQDRAGHTRTIRPHDAFNSVRGNQTFRSGCRRTRIRAGGIRAYRGDLGTIQQQATVCDFFHRQFRAIRHRGGQRFNRTGKAQDHAKFDFSCMATRDCTCGNQGRRCACKKQLFH